MSKIKDRQSINDFVELVGKTNKGHYVQDFPDREDFILPNSHENAKTCLERKEVHFPNEIKEFRSSSTSPTALEMMSGEIFLSPASPVRVPFNHQEFDWNESDISETSHFSTQTNSRDDILKPKTVNTTPETKVYNSFDTVDTIFSINTTADQSSRLFPTFNKLWDKNRKFLCSEGIHTSKRVPKQREDNYFPLRKKQCIDESSMELTALEFSNTVSERSSYSYVKNDDITVYMKKNSDMLK